MSLMAQWHNPQKWRMPNQLASWLTERGSLTRRLQCHSRYGFAVELLANSWIKALSDECLLLGIDFNALCYQREVRLLDGQESQIYARTIIPRSTYQAMKHRFDHLGNQSLGEWLFTDPRVKRGQITISKLHPGQWLYEMAVLSENTRPDALWARRSLFHIQNKALLVNEIFLSNFEYS